MKCRNGFVSNSSSSSFVLSYAKNSVLTDPKKILEYLKESNGPIIFKGWDLGEGDDIFELDEDQKSLIRKFPKEFISANSGTTSRNIYEYDEKTEDLIDKGQEEIPKLTAYIGDVYFRDVCAFVEYYSPDIDMSDIPNEELTMDEILDKNPSRELLEKRKISDNWYRIKNEREKQARIQKRAELIAEGREAFLKKHPDSNPEDIISEMVLVSNRSCDSDGCYDLEEFADRYLSEEFFENIDCFSFRKCDKQKIKSFALIYRRVLEDKTEILEYLRVHNNLNPSYMCWSNEIYNTVREAEDIDFFEIGKEEREILLNNSESFLKTSKKIELFVDSDIIIDTGIISLPTSSKFNVVTGYGKIAKIEKGTDLIDFKRNFLK